MTETLIGQTTRPVTFTRRNAKRVIDDMPTYPAGTEVYVERILRHGWLDIRIPGSLYIAQVASSSIAVP